MECIEIARRFVEPADTPCLVLGYCVGSIRQQCGNYNYDRREGDFVQHANLKGLATPSAEIRFHSDIRFRHLPDSWQVWGQDRAFGSRRQLQIAAAFGAMASIPTRSRGARYLVQTGLCRYAGDRAENVKGFG